MHLGVFIYMILKVNELRYTRNVKIKEKLIQVTAYLLTLLFYFFQLFLNFLPKSIGKFYILRTGY